jgi:alanine racemase
MNDATARWLDGPASWLELSRANLLHNLAGVRGLVAPARVMAVLKANAYGAGAVGMARVLAEAGVDAFAVATVAEGIELRQGGIAGMIVCLGCFTRQEIPAIFAHELTPGIFHAAAGQALAEQARILRRVLPVWVKVDTGLGRLGVPCDAAAGFLRELGGLAGLEVAGIFSTLTENPTRDPLQVERLLAVRRALPGLASVPLSLASSHAIVSLPASYADMVRPGIILHGLEPSERDRMDLRLVSRADLRPIATWKARVGDVKTIAAGEQVGYGCQPSLTVPTRVAVLTIGWATGYGPALNRGGMVLIHGCACPVLAVSANSTMVDAGPAPAAAVGDEAVLLGRQAAAEITAAQLAQVAGGSVYRLLAAVPREVARFWY